jgi:large subunit ribosomal protein L6
MSRVGKKPIPIPQGVKIQLDGLTVRAEGPKGKLSQVVPVGLTPRVADGTLVIERHGEDRRVRALHGLARALVANMVKGVREPFVRELEIQGVGYRAEASGQQLKLSLGFSHPVTVAVPAGLKVSVQENKIRIEGSDKGLVGQFAANVRELRPPEPYKGKGIRYVGEHVRRKVGKAGTA